MDTGSIVANSVLSFVFRISLHNQPQDDHKLLPFPVGINYP